MSKEWTFVQACDSHLGSPRSYRFRPAVNHRWAAIKEQMAALKPDLLLHGGDLTRDGELHEEEYELARDDLDTLPFPTFVIPGNMDVGNKHTSVTGTKQPWNDVALNMRADRLDLFASYFGPIQWTFLYREIRFTGFYAAVASESHSHEERLWKFLEKLPGLPPARHHVAVMHYWPFIEDPNEREWDITDTEEYDAWYFSIDSKHRLKLLALLESSGVEILFCGHAHVRRPPQEVGGMRVFRSASAGTATSQMRLRWPDTDSRVGFHLCKVNESGIEVSFVPGADQREEHDTYGPWGHPSPEERDYALARIKPSFTPR